MLRRCPCFSSDGAALALLEIGVVRSVLCQWRQDFNTLTLAQVEGCCSGSGKWDMLEIGDSNAASHSERYCHPPARMRCGAE